jgi:hypothetical protein
VVKLSVFRIGRRMRGATLRKHLDICDPTSPQEVWRPGKGTQHSFLYASGKMITLHWNQVDPDVWVRKPGKKVAWLVYG